MAGLFAAVVGQPQAVDQLRRSARRPVHAYLIVGAAGTGGRELARGFAAAVLCPNGGCGACEVCRRALTGVHPDLVETERAGAALTVGEAQALVQLAQRRPVEGRRQVLVVPDVHLARLAAPVLLKTLEEPAGPTVFVLLAETVPPELATVASRCVTVELGPVPAGALRDWLVGQGVDAGQAVELAQAAGGNLERAAVLAHDPDVAARRALWRSVPGRLDGTGTAAANLAAELVASCERAVEPLRARNQSELEEAAAAAEALGQRGLPGRKELEDRHRREERRWRVDTLRAGLATLAAAYRDRLLAEDVGTGLPPARAAERARSLAGAVAVIDAATAELVRNPNETLMVEALLVRLSAVAG